MEQRRVNQNFIDPAIKSLEPIFGSWRIDSLIGRGTYGTVYKVCRESRGRTIFAALKHILIGPGPEGAGMPENDAKAYYSSVADSYKREAMIMDKLKDSPNIVSIKRFAAIPSSDGLTWHILILMELLTPVADYFSKTPPSEQDVKEMGLGISSALELCGKNHIIHQDVKPENIFVSGTGVYKLGDFGAARAGSRPKEQTVMIGSYNYMAPEVYQGKPYGTSSDLYSLGIVLYWCLNGCRLPLLPRSPEPYTFGDVAGAIARRVIDGESLPPPQFAGDAIAKVVLKAASFEEKDRYSSAKELKEALEAIGPGSEEPLWTIAPRPEVELPDVNVAPYMEEQDGAKEQDSVSMPKKMVGHGEMARTGSIVEGLVTGVFSRGERKQKKTGKNRKKEEKHRKEAAAGGGVPEPTAEANGTEDRKSRIKKKLVNWVLFTCLLSLIPLVLYLLLRLLFSVDVPATNKIASELLYLGLTLSIVILRELTSFESQKRKTPAYQAAEWLTIIILAFSAILFAIMNANDLNLFNKNLSDKSILGAALILSAISIVFGMIIQIWEEK